MAYPDGDVEKLIKIKVLDGFDSILCYLAAKSMATFVSQGVGNVSVQ